MVRPRSLKKPRVVAVNVESDVYEKIMSLLPRDTSFADKVREWMLKELESLDMEKNEQGTSDPLNLKPSTSYDVDEVVMSFDICKLSEEEAREKVHYLIREKNVDAFRKYNPIAVIFTRGAITAFKIASQLTEDKIRERKSMYNPRDGITEIHAYHNTVFDEGE